MFGEEYGFPKVRDDFFKLQEGYEKQVYELLKHLVGKEVIVRLLPRGETPEEKSIEFEGTLECYGYRFYVAGRNFQIAAIINIYMYSNKPCLIISLDEYPPKIEELAPSTKAISVKELINLASYGTPLVEVCWDNNPERKSIGFLEYTEDGGICLSVNSYKGFMLPRGGKSFLQFVPEDVLTVHRSTNTPKIFIALRSRQEEKEEEPFVDRLEEEYWEAFPNGQGHLPAAEII